jgi:hypothetical protein
MTTFSPVHGPDVGSGGPPMLDVGGGGPIFDVGGMGSLGRDAGSGGPL